MHKVCITTTAVFFHIIIIIVMWDLRTTITTKLSISCFSREALLRHDYHKWVYIPVVMHVYIWAVVCAAYSTQNHTMCSIPPALLLQQQQQHIADCG